MIEFQLCKLIEDRVSKAKNHSSGFFNESSSRDWVYDAMKALTYDGRF